MSLAPPGAALPPRCVAALAGSRPAATSPRSRLASVRAVSTVQGEPNGPIVTLRSGAARPLPARYMRMKLRAPLALTRSPKPFTPPSPASQSTVSRGVPSGRVAGAAVSQIALGELLTGGHWGRSLCYLDEPEGSTRR